ncbi:MAG: PKD domain-containing protein [Methanomicrobiaceae archaeon]|nr:PKD domain-containing protein [Methanomicrobiaceae archaeon]
MECRRDQIRQVANSANEDGIAELMGALLLTALIAVAIGILAVVVLSGFSSAETPALRVGLTNEEGYIDMIHLGGDTLYRETTQIWVNGVDQTNDFETPEGYAWSTFSVGDHLTSSIPYAYGTEILIVYTGSENPTVIETLFCQQGVPPPVADFTFIPMFGYVPLEVFFEDTSSGDPTSWYWDFGDNSTSAIRNPTHTYSNSGFYEITLTVCNEGGCDSITKFIIVFGFSDYVENESVFVYGSQLSFTGTGVSGPGSTVIITGGLDTADLNGGTSIDVSTIYIDGPVTLDGGSAGLGSSSDPDAIYVNGDLTLWSGTRHIYGDVYVNGSFSLKDAWIHGNVYVNGDLTLSWTPTLDAGSHIYYNGVFTHPPSMSPLILDKCIYQEDIPGFTMPGIELPSAKSDEFYTSRGYVSGGALTSGIKIFADSYSRAAQWDDTAENIIIVAKTGDITLTNYWGIPVTGVLFAPNGKVTFNGESFEGVVIARDGFFVTSGATSVLFTNIDQYVSNPDDYPF